MNIDDAVELDLTFAEMAFKKSYKAFIEGFRAGYEEGLNNTYGSEHEALTKAWERFTNGRR